MSIATVVTRGYGSFGSVNLLPTLGYSLAATVAGPLYASRLDVFQWGAQGQDVAKWGAQKTDTMRWGAQEQDART